MKTNTKNKKQFKPGLTLIELTVVIVVLLSLIGVLFIGTRAWKNGSDRATCIVNLRNFQQAARSYANLNDVAIGGALTEENLVNAEFISGTGGASSIVCPANALAYNYGAVVPEIGALWATCPNGGEPADGEPGEALNHTPSSITGW